MSSHRIERLQEEIRHEVSRILLFEMTEALLQRVTLTRVVLTRDLSLARIYYEAPEDPAGKPDLKKALKEGLDRARGFVRKQLAGRLRLKMLPKIEFYYDETQAELARVDALLSGVSKAGAIS